MSEVERSLEAHPTVKPVALVADAIKDASKPKNIVLDPFCGSGTTILAAEKTGQRRRGIEYEPRYVDVIVERATKLLFAPFEQIRWGMLLRLVSNHPSDLDDAGRVSLESMRLE